MSFDDSDTCNNNMMKPYRCDARKNNKKIIQKGFMISKDIAKNQIKAWDLIKSNNNLIIAENLLLGNIDLDSSDHINYDYLLNMYRKQDDFHKIVLLLNMAIKKSKAKKQIYREIKKVVILNKILKDIENN